MGSLFHHRKLEKQVTPDQYRAKTDRLEIPSGPDWNQRFLFHLALLGLKLSTEMIEDYHTRAPWPVSDECVTWDRECYIVEST